MLSTVQHSWQHRHARGSHWNFPAHPPLHLDLDDDCTHRRDLRLVRPVDGRHWYVRTASRRSARRPALTSSPPRPSNALVQPNRLIATRPPRRAERRRPRRRSERFAGGRCTSKPSPRPLHDRLRTRTDSSATSSHPPSCPTLSSMIDMLKLVAFVYVLQLVPCVHAGDLINSGPAHGMGATAAWLAIAALTSRLGGADAQYNPSEPAHPGGETFGNDEIYEACRVAAHEVCLVRNEGNDNCGGFNDSSPENTHSYHQFQLGCQFYNQGFQYGSQSSGGESWECCDFMRCNDACVRCVARCGNCQPAANCCCHCCC